MKDTNKCLGALPCSLPRPLPGPLPSPSPQPGWAAQRRSGSSTEEGTWVQSVGLTQVPGVTQALL